jgi:hypothetical protein
MFERRSSRPKITLQDRLSAWAKVVREQAVRLPPGRERDDMLKKARQADTSAHLDDWANSPGLRPPK